MDEVFVEFMGKTFGQKIDTFKARCRTRNFTDAHRKILDDVEGELDRLLPKRNLIAWTTYQMGKDGTPPQPYRIGMTKAGEFMNEAIEQDFDAPHVFTVDRIKETTAKFVAARANLGIVTTEVMKELATKR